MKNLLLNFVGFLLISTISAEAQMPPPPPPPPMPRSITVTGEADAQVAPDQAALSLSLQNRDAELEKAKKANDALLEKLVKITRDFEIPKEKVATSGLYISPEYRYDNDGKQHFQGYMVNRSLRITIDKLDIHEKLLSAVIAAGVDQVNGIDFMLANPEASAGKVRVKAMENAHARAEAMATAAGVKLGKPLMISTSGTPPMPIPRPMMAMAMSAEAKMADSVTPSLPGLISLHESVSVTYEME